MSSAEKDYTITIDVSPEVYDPWRKFLKQRKLIGSEGSSISGIRDLNSKIFESIIIFAMKGYISEALDGNITPIMDDKFALSCNAKEE